MRKDEYQRIFENEETHWWYVGMKEISKSLLKSLHLNKNAKILDAGCGTGYMLAYLSKFGKTYGIDISPEAIKFCKERRVDNVRQASIDKIPFQDNSFNLVTSFDVLYHQRVKDDIRSLKELHRVLIPQGFLLIRVPAYDWLRGQHDEVVATRHRYTANELERKLTECGFKIKKITYANFFLFPLAILKRFGDRFVASNHSDIHPSGNLLNSLLQGILLTEARLITKINFPFGLSLFCLAEKVNLQNIPKRKEKKQSPNK